MSFLDVIKVLELILLEILRFVNLSCLLRRFWTKLVGGLYSGFITAVLLVRFMRFMKSRV